MPEVLSAASDIELMEQALALAARVPTRPWPNPPVGALVVRDGTVVGRGAHHGPGTPHAEAVALAEAGAAARGATLYCTLEPCNHQGRMPPCAPDIVRSGIGRAVVAMRDPNPNVEGGGFRVLRRAGIEVVTGVLAREALELAWPFVVTRAFERPFVLLKTATSLDGRFGPSPGAVVERPFYLTGVEARQDVHRLRRWSDAVLVGGDTARLDQPRLDTRLLDADAPCPGGEPLPAVASRTTPREETFAGRRWVWFTTTESARLASDVPLRHVVACNTHRDHLDLCSLVWEFGRQVGHCLMVEAGPTLAAALLREGLVDRWVAYTAPTVVGSGPSWGDVTVKPPPAGAPARLASRQPKRQGGVGFVTSSVHRVGNDVKAVYDREDFEMALRRVTLPVEGDA